MALVIHRQHGTHNVQKRVLPVKYIVVHYVGAGTSAAGNARNNCIYFGGGYRGASAHYFIDDGGVWEYADPGEFITWHCGDGHGMYGITNANSIGIEVCQDGDRPFTATEITYLKQLVTSLMKRYNVPADHVVRHYDASRKECPYYYVKRPAEWEALRKTITGASTAKKEKKPLTKTERIKKGQRGLNKLVGAKLAIDGSRGPQTKKVAIMAVQVGMNHDYNAGLDVDGLYGPASKGAVKQHPVKKGAKGDYIRAIQCLLYVNGYDPTGIDGGFGKGTDAAVYAFQKDNGLTINGEPDKIVGAKTMLRLLV